MSYLKADGFDSAIVGICRFSNRIVYDKSKMCDILIENGMSKVEAVEYLYFHVWQTYVGQCTPIYIDLMDIEEIEEIISHKDFDL